MSEAIGKAKGFALNGQMLKAVGWLSAAVVFVSLALLILSFSFMPLSSNSSLEKGLTIRLAFVWITNCIALVAGLALHRGEKVKSAIVIALTFFFTPLLYVGTALYFKPTRLKRVVFAVGGILVALSSLLGMTACFKGSAIIPYVQCGLGLVIAVLHLVLAACFVSRQYLPVEDYILKSAKFLLKPLENIHSLYSEDGYKACFVYGYSVFIVGIFCFTVLLILASSGSIDIIDIRGGYGRTEKLQLPWDPDLTVSALTQLIGCIVWGCFIFSQIFCARKLRGHLIVAGSAPVHLLIVRYMCLVLVACVAVGVLRLLFGDISDKGMASDWALHLTLANIPFLVGASRYCSPKTAITLSSIVTIWHLLGSSFVALLIRDNIAKVRSLGNEGAPATDHET